MKENEKVVSFFQGLKPQIHLQLMKVGARAMNNTSITSINVYAALYGAGTFSYTPYRSPSGSMPANIENAEQHIRIFRGACYR